MADAFSPRLPVGPSVVNAWRRHHARSARAQPVRDTSPAGKFLETAGAAAAIAAFPAVVSAQSKEVKVGYILPVTGPLAFEAALALNGMLLAVDEINAGGGIKSLGGAKIALLPGDTQNKVELGNSEAARLIDQNVVALDRPLLEPGRVFRPPGHREEQDAVPAPGRRRRQPLRGRAPLHLPDAAERQGHGHAHRQQHGGDGEGRQPAGQARGDDARGRKLRHHDGQPRRGVRQVGGLRARPARPVQPEVAGLHRRAGQDQGGAPRPPA